MGRRNRNKDRDRKGVNTNLPISIVNPKTTPISITENTLGKSSDDLFALLKTLPTKQQVIDQYVTVRDAVRDIRTWKHIKELKTKFPEICIRVKGTEKGYTNSTRNLILHYRYKNICGKITIAPTYSFATAYVNVVSHDGKIKYNECFYSEFNPLKTNLYTSKAK